MISGIVNAELEAVIGLTTIGDKGQKVRIEAIIDTGYNGWLILSPQLIAALGYTWHGRCDSLLADGSEAKFDIYAGAVLWDRRRRNIPVDSAECAPLVGMALLQAHEVNIQARSGGSVTIRRLPKE